LVTYKRHLVITQLNRLERYEEAVDLYRVKLEAQRADLGERHHWLAGTLHGLATSLRLMGDLEASEGPLREALAISEKVWGTDHRITRDVRDQLIATMEELGGTHDLGDATSLELDPPMGSPSDEEIDLTIEIERLIATDDLVSAIEVAERGVAVAGATHGEESLGITPALMRLAELLERRGLFEDALAREERALEIVRLHVAEDDPRHLSARRRIADLLSRNLPRDRKSPDTAAQLAEAMKHYERELSIRTSAGESNPELAKLLGLMGGRMLLADPGRSEGYFARAAQMWGDTLGFDSHERFGSLVAMVSCFVGQEHYDEAESLALELLERAAATGRPDGPGVTQLLGNLRSVYRSTGRKDEAEAVLARILASQ
jgi:tetratricopeptide (TPR) repeat protein